MNLWQEVAAKRFPRSVRRIYGSGRHALVTKCNVPWSVLLYNTREERLEKYNSLERSKCTALRCGYDHVFVDLEISGAAIAMGGSPTAS
jgi:hypothetical protein